VDGRIADGKKKFLVTSVEIKGRNNGHTDEGRSIRIYVGVDDADWVLCGITTSLAE
jgi:hypothetical protein